MAGQGRGIFDCRTGERIARDDSPPDEGWYDVNRLTAIGIGPLEGREIRLSGLNGGGLRSGSRKGWNVKSITIAWPDQHLLLVKSSGKGIYDQETNFAKLEVESEVRAFGFSESGESLILATNNSLMIYGMLEIENLPTSLIEESDRRRARLATSRGSALTWESIMDRVRGRVRRP